MLLTALIVSVFTISFTFAGSDDLCRDGEKRQIGFNQNGYLKCMNGKWYQHECLDNEIFDTRSEKCQYSRKRRGYKHPLQDIEAIRKQLGTIKQDAEGSNPTQTTTATATTSTTTSTAKPTIPKKKKPVFPAECGILRLKRIVGAVNKVAGGEFTEVEENPWQIAIMKRPKSLSCGGSIISKYHVVTAAHCFVRRDAEKMVKVAKESRFIFAGNTNLTAEGFVYNISQIHTHDQYNPENKQNDIAILKIEGIFQFSDSIQPICLPYDPDLYATHTFVIISGWGSEGSSGSTPVEILKRGALKITTEEYCKRNNENYVTITETMFCAAENEGQKINRPRTDTCQGDSGGPLSASAGGRHYLLGITSWGVECGLATHPGVYTKVILYKDWIKQIAENSTLGPGEN